MLCGEPVLTAKSARLGVVFGKVPDQGSEARGAVEV